MSDILRCVGCGKPIEAGTQTYRITTGKTTEGQGFDEKKEFGRMHQPCFEQSVDSPQLAMARIKRMATPTTVVDKKRRA
jgi:hypothetical protein